VVTAGVRVAIRVRPGSSHERVRGTTPQGELQVWVHAPAADGRATEAALRAVADALAVRRSSVRLLRGATSRVKLVEVDGDPAGLLRRLDELRAR
jgi:uncharacterized protein